MRRMPLAIALCIALGEAPELTAQGRGPIAPGLIQGGSIERYQLDQSVVFSYRATRYRPRAPGIDLGVGVFPRYLADQVLALTLDAGLAQATRLGPSLLFLRGGAGALLLAGDGYGGAAPALQAGLALVIPLDGRTGLRIDLGQHWYLIDGQSERRWSVGVGFAALPKQR